MNNNQKEDEIKINPKDFLTWYRNACTSNTQEQANQIFTKLPRDKQESLINEYKYILLSFRRR